MADAIGKSVASMNPGRRAEIAAVIGRETDPETIAATIRGLFAASHDPASKTPANIAVELAGSEGKSLALKGRGLGPVLAPKAAKAMLDEATIDDESTDWAASELLGVGELADRLGMARTSIDGWRKAGKVIAFAKGIRNFVFPVAQFEGMRPLPGIDRVLTQFETPEEAWEWLNIPEHVLGGRTPLSALRGGDVDEVENAARGRLGFA